MCGWHAKYVGLAGKRKISEKELDRLARLLTSKKVVKDYELDRLVEGITGASTGT
jgi:hypothetical protein